MDAAIWGIVVLVVFPLLQFPVIVYLSRRVETDEELLPSWEYKYPFDSDSTLPSATGEPFAPSPAGASSPPSTLACPRCGIENDPVFTYCRDCVARL